ncbi:hypothetical protein CVU37_13325 [candidate division BRC1 bacterium HGW-BRC1-1]|jgi:geranylgeranyl pyrophosphate synthase|nr:MAG: hypothetical protein CVU37_13325 [candidate division BRC1 bacterium HGW-BRC1-1]
MGAMMIKLSDELEKFFAEGGREVEAALRKVTAPDEEPIANLDDGLLYALGLDAGASAQGKRLRPLLCLLVSDSLCGRTDQALPFAASIELMHNFALVHDDIEDGDEYRRGRPSAWKRYGVPHAVNLGDYLFTKIFAALLLGEGAVPAEKMVRFFALMTKTLDHTHRGQALDMNARFERIDLAHYMRIVTNKTGYYLAAPLVAGAIAADAGAEVEQALQRYGMAIGPMFQIRDDLIDLTHGKGREAVGSDVCEGKRSFLAAFVFERGAANEAARLEEILNKERSETTPEDVAEVLEMFNRTGAMAEARRVCEEMTEQALVEIDGLPEPLRGRLVDVTRYLAARQA